MCRSNITVAPQNKVINTGAIAVKETGKQRACLTCGWQSEAMHLVTLTSKDSLTSFTIPLCETCAEKVADELLAAIEAGYVSNNLATTAGS